MAKLFGITYLVGKIKFKLSFFRVHWLSEFSGKFFFAVEQKLGNQEKVQAVQGVQQKVLHNMQHQVQVEKRDQRSEIIPLEDHPRTDVSG